MSKTADILKASLKSKNPAVVSEAMGELEILIAATEKWEALSTMISTKNPDEIMVSVDGYVSSLRETLHVNTEQQGQLEMKWLISLLASKPGEIIYGGMFTEIFIVE